MDQWQALITETSINGEVLCVHGDDFGSRMKFREHDQRCITRIHLRIFFKQFADADSVLPDRQELDSPGMHRFDCGKQSRTVLAKQMEHLTPYGFGCAERLVQHGESRGTPSVPLIGTVKQANHRAGIHKVINRRSLHASTDQAGRL